MRGKGILKFNVFVASAREAPNIEGRACARGEPPIGEFTRIEIVGHIDYELIAEPV